MGIYSNYITESTLPINDLELENILKECNNFDKIIKSINVLTENNIEIINEKFDLSVIKTAIKNFFKSIGKFFVMIGKAIATFFGTIKNKIMSKIKNAVKNFDITHDKEPISYEILNNNELSSLRSKIKNFDQTFNNILIEYDFYYDSNNKETTVEDKLDYINSIINNCIDTIDDIDLDEYFKSTTLRNTLSEALTDIVVMAENIYLEYDDITKLLKSIEKFNKDAEEKISKAIDNTTSSENIKKLTAITKLTKRQALFINDYFEAVKKAYNKYFVSQYNDFIQKYAKTASTTKVKLINSVDVVAFDKENLKYDFDKAKEYLRSSGIHNNEDYRSTFNINNFE